MYAVHYALLGGLSGTWCNIVGIVVLFILFYKEKSNSKSKIFIPIVLLLFILGSIYFYDGLLSLIPSVATLIPLVLNYNKNMNVVKTGGIIGAILWLVYGIYVLSYATILTEGIFLISTIVSMLFVKESKKHS